MTTNVHPTSSELLMALHEPDQAISTLEHLDECLACRVRLSRLRHASELAVPTDDSIQRIVEASTPLPELIADMVRGDKDREPQPAEVWRVGRNEALLVWVRRVFDDGVADVIPLVLDTGLADQESLLVAANATPLATETAAMVALRTHIHLDAFLNRIGSLDIDKDVTEVMTAVREGRKPSGVRVGPPIADDNDQRLEYRQALRDLLAELSPSVWLENQDDPEAIVEQEANEPAANHSSNGIDGIKAQLDERLLGVTCHNVEPQIVAVDHATRAVSVLKVVYLDAAVLVVMLRGRGLAEFPGDGRFIAACQQMAETERDADAVAIALPEDDCPTLLFTTADLRNAVELPGGAHKGPNASVEGYGLVDTLCKHFEGVVTSWEVAEPPNSRIGTRDLHQTVVRFASTSIEQIVAAGKRAHQPAKQAAWQGLPEDLGDRVANFVVALVNEESLDKAFLELALERLDD
jgi:hypothetical protein